MRRYYLLTFTAMAIPLLAHHLVSPRTQPRPATLGDVAALVEERGLYWAAEGAAGLNGNRLVVSLSPVTRDRISSLRVNNPRHPCWDGTIIIDVRVGELMTANHDPGRSVAWEGMWVFGDPNVIDRLTGTRPRS